MNTLSGLSAAEVIRLLELKPHPEGGHYRETFRDPAGPEGRGFSTNGHDASAHHLGKDLSAGQRPQIVVPAGHWQSATSLGAWTLVGCTVAPGFAFSGFEMAPPDWRPTPRPAGG